MTRSHRGCIRPRQRPSVSARPRPRIGSASQPPFDAAISATEQAKVPKRSPKIARVSARLALPREPARFKQVPGTCVIDAGQAAPEPEADAAVALNPGVVSAMLTADWLPVLLCDREGTRVAAAHAGLRGLAPGVLEATIGALGVSRGRVEIFLSSSS